MEEIFDVVKILPRIKKEDSLVDRLSNRYSVLILTTFAVVLSVTSWVGKPIHCWFPQFVSSYQRAYGHSYCWVSNTYYLPYSEYIPRVDEDDKRRVIRYYQWIPWIMVTQAILFYLPSTVWKNFNSKSGIDASDVLQLARKLQLTKEYDRREERLGLLAKTLHRFLKPRAANSTKCGCCGRNSQWSCCCSGRRLDCYLVALFLVSKLFYVGNVLFQLYGLNRVLNTNYHAFPKEYVQFYHKNNTSQYFLNSPVFPRVSMCDLTIRVIGNLQRHTVQCVLPLNYYVEKMYLFFWFWLVFLLVATSVDLLVWLLRAASRTDRLNFVSNHLVSGAIFERDSRPRELSVFVDDYLQRDGSFVLRLVAHNTDTVTTTDVIATLWKTWSENETPLRDLEEGF